MGVFSKEKGFGEEAIFNEETIRKNTKTYTNKERAFRAMLGGIGTGNLSLDERGAMCDFEMMNHPDKGLKVPYTFFSMWSREGEEESRAFVLETKPEGICSKALGHPSGELYGLPRMDSCTIETNYPYFKYDFKREGLPFDVVMEAYTPFIPLNAKDSGIPGFSVTYSITNRSGKLSQVSVCGTMYNFTGYLSYDGYDKLYQDGEPYNELVDEGGLKGIFYGNRGLAADAVNAGTLALACANQQVTCKPRWMAGGWWDGAEEFWQDFREDGEISPDVDSDAVGSSIAASDMPKLVGSVCAKETLQPGETKKFTFYLTWNFPNRYGWWPDGHARADEKPLHDKVWKNYYSTLWPDAWEALKYFHREEERLNRHSRNFSKALYSTTLDADVIESLIAAVHVIRSNTCFRIADGRFFAWEGCFEHAGSCAGTCTHVWNYAQALAFLFPELERSARKTEFLEETDEEGNMAFRAKRLLDGRKWDMLPAADGQLGTILRVCREWQISGDDTFLKEVWEKVVSAMEFSLRNWDTDGDGVLDSKQHNTYDIEFYGLNSLTNSMLYAALAACCRMAEYLGEEELAEKWRKLLEKGSKKMDEQLFNGEYYEQGIADEDLNRYKYQYGKGCLADQLLGQELAHICSLGYVLPEEHVKKAVHAVYENNFKKNLRDHESVQRSYAYPDEGGLILCSWPKGGRPKQPFVYSDEVWTGIEYQAATHLIYEGYVDEAMEIVHTLRRRYNGSRRSPYNEIECGNHYARSMAAWGLLIALSGFECDLPHDKVSFAPRTGKDDFACFYSHGHSWGIYRQRRQEDGKLAAETVALYEA